MSSNNNTKCIICLCIFENEQDSVLISPCSDSSHIFCKECLIQYIENIISNTSHGICPIITCPYPHARIKSILLYEKWNHLISFSVLSKYKNIANSLISTICGRCHTIKTLICSECIPNDNNHFNKLIHSFSNGSMSINDFYHTIFISPLNSELIHTFSDGLPTGENDILFNKIQYILKSISNPERKTLLYLRFLKDFPRIFTRCCNTEQCFQCRVTPFHHGKTCAEISTTVLDHSIILCPACSLQLTKGDGCNHVTCICGNSFNWKTEKELCEKCLIFKTIYPQKTSFECTKVLCSDTSSLSDILYAKAWRKKHLTEVNEYLYDWFKSTFSPFPSQVCAILLHNDSMSKIYGIKHASKLWYNIHKTEVDNYMYQNNIAIKSIFPTFFPNPTERPIAAYTILHDVSSRFINYNKKILESVNLWINENPQLYQDGATHSELQKSISFLYLYGKYTPNEINQNNVPSSSWDRIRSNPSLLYTNNNLTVERVSDTSCYPTVFSSKINTIISNFRIQLDQFQPNNNWFSFGISSHHMQNSYSDGVGKTPNSWGIMNHCNSSVNRSYLFANCIHEGCFRVLQENDILSIYINIPEGWFELFINDTEQIYRFRIPKVLSLDLSNYYFTMTLANDNKISILTPDLDSMNSKIGTVVSHEEHQPLFFSFLKIMRQLYRVIYQTKTNNDRLMRIMKVYNTQLDEMDNRFLFSQEDEYVMDTYIQYLLFNPNENNTGLYSWGNIFQFIYRKYKYQLEQQQQKKEELARGFRNSFEKDAPFIAALHLKHYYDIPETKSTDVYLAYMNTFPDEQHDWYKSNSILQTPIIENIAPNCNCLPRRLIQCPVCN